MSRWGSIWIILPKSVYVCLTSIRVEMKNNEQKKEEAKDSYWVRGQLIQANIIELRNIDHKWMQQKSRPNNIGAWLYAPIWGLMHLQGKGSISLNNLPHCLRWGWGKIETWLWINFTQVSRPLFIRVLLNLLKVILRISSRNYKRMNVKTSRQIVYVS